MSVRQKVTAFMGSALIILAIALMPLTYGHCYVNSTIFEKGFTCFFGGILYPFYWSIELFEWLK